MLDKLRERLIIDCHCLFKLITLQRVQDCAKREYTGYSESMTATSERKGGGWGRCHREECNGGNLHRADVVDERSLCVGIEDTKEFCGSKGTTAWVRNKDCHRLEYQTQHTD